MASDPQFYALIVGVDRYKSSSVSDLRGCTADAKAMYAFLTTRLDVPAENIRLLTASQDESESSDRLPSHRNILSAWQDLIDRVSEGDQIFFHYSGHGAQARSIDPNEPDGYDETLVPFDSRDLDENGAPVYDILDKELATLIDVAESKGVYVTAFLDCCHSGSGTRAAEAPDPTKPMVRRGPNDDRIRPKETLVRGAAERAQGTTRSVSGWTIPSEHVLLAGCRDEELSHEYRAPETGEWQGATTYFLLKALQDYHPDMTWRQVHDFVQTRVNAVYERQSPQLEGPDNRKVFGGMAAPETPHLLVTAVEKQGEQQEFVYVKVNGGAALGLSEGSRVAIYPIEGSMDGDPLATGTVERTRVDHAWARLETDVSADQIEVPSRATIVARGYDSLVYPVGVDDERVIQALQSGEEGLSSFLEITSADDPGARFRVVVQNDRYVIQDGSGAQIVSQSQPRTADGARQIAENLEHLAIYNNVRYLRNPSPLPMLEDAITVQAVSYSRAGFTSPKDPLPLDDANAALTPGRKVWLSVRNNTNEPLYISVFNLSANYGIHRLYPDRAPYQKVEGGKDFFVSDLEPEIHNPFATKSREIFKIFATKDPTSFDVLELPELNEPLPRAGTRAEGPLAELLNGIRHRGTRKMVIKRDDTHERWITKQVEITVLADNQRLPLDRDVSTVEIGTPLAITVEKPAAFAADLFVSSVTQLTRGGDLEETIQLPPGLRTPDAQRIFQPLAFSGSTRSTAETAGVLALNSTPQQLQSINEENPLRMELTVEDEPDLAGILPIAYDGEFYYLAGQQAQPKTRATSDPGTRRLALEITQLPLPVDEAEAAPGARTAGDVPTRDLKRTVRLFLYKVYKGELPADTGVRRVVWQADGTPSYAPIERNDVIEDGATQVQKAALFIHGFTSDTGWLAQKVLPILHRLQGYDLYLAYDYESFNTGVKENGEILAQALADLGFGAGDGIHLDVFCHSMGTQIARCVVELNGGDAYVDRVFMGGPPNAGSRLAEAKKLIYWLGTVALNHAGLTPPTLIASWFFDKLIDSAVGVEDMRPSSELYQKLNDAATPIDVPYFVQIGTNSIVDDNFDWQMLFSKAGLMKIFDAGLDQVLGGPNDLAVSVRSARNVRRGNWPHLTLETLPGNHFQYFFSPEGETVLARWLG